MSGYFISIEGVDGSGKSTQIRMLNEYLIGRGVEVVLTREPGGTHLAEKIREVILDTENTSMTAMTEMLLYAASRAQHVEEKIVPALMEGKVVLSDRYMDSSIAYQGYARGLGSIVESVNMIATRDRMPDLTIFLNMSPRDGISRKQVQEEHTLDRLEEEKIEFHEKVYNGFLDICKRDTTGRIFSIDANRDEESVFFDIKLVVDNLLGLKSDEDSGFYEGGLRFRA